MARKKTTVVAPPTPTTTEPEQTVSVLDQVDDELPLVGGGEVIEEAVSPWDTEAVMAEQQMAGDMARMLLERIKTMTRLWGDMTTNQQQELLDGILAGCASLSRQAVETVASRGRKIVNGHVKGFVAKDSELIVTISCPKSNGACAAFGMAVGRGRVYFLLMETEGLLEFGSPIPVGKVQMELPLGDEVIDAVVEEPSTVDGESLDLFSAGEQDMEGLPDFLDAGITDEMTENDEEELKL